MAEVTALEKPRRFAALQHRNFTLLFMNGVSATAVGSIIATFIQVTVPNELRGRIISLYTITLIGLPSLGSLGSGAVAELLGGIQGAPRAVLIGGVVVGVIIIFTAPLFWRRVMNRH
ncbi:MAG: hypothetical protein ACM3U0_01035 [archaeon]